MTGPAVVGRVQARRRADAGRARLRAQARRRGVGARARRDAEGHLPRATGKHQRGRAAVDVLPDVLAARPARHGVPQADALGRVARRRPRRAAVRASDPLDPVPLRRPRRAVHDPPQRRGAVGPRAGGPVGRRHLRPPVPRDQRPRGPRHQGAHRSTSTARSWSRTSCCSTAASATTRSPASSTPTRSGSAGRVGARGVAVGPAAGGARPGRVPGGRRRHVRRRVPDAARGSADDDDDSPPALLPGGEPGRPADAGVPRGHQHAGRLVADHRAQLRARAHGAPARRALLLRRRPRARGSSSTCRRLAHACCSTRSWGATGEGRAARAPRALADAETCSGRPDAGRRTPRRPAAWPRPT